MVSHARVIRLGEGETADLHVPTGSRTKAMQFPEGMPRSRSRNVRPILAGRLREAQDARPPRRSRRT